ncbi:hypothetical protein LDENG_00034480, partial [Lucifuga dentata]
SNRRSHITHILSGLHWLPINFRVHFKILVLTFRALHGQAPPYLVDLIHTYSASHSLRSSGQKLLVVSRTRLKTRGDHTFQAVTPNCGMLLPLLSVLILRSCLEDR